MAIHILHSFFFERKQINLIRVRGLNNARNISLTQIQAHFKFPIASPHTQTQIHAEFIFVTSRMTF